LDQLTFDFHLECTISHAYCSSRARNQQSKSTGYACGFEG
jgi:hypothetical protein